MTVQESDPGNELEGRPRTWNTVAVLRGDVRPWSGVGGREYEQSSQVFGEVTHRVWTPQEGIAADSSMRLIVEPPSGREMTLEVVAVYDYEGRAKFHEWRCKETT